MYSNKVYVSSLKSEHQKSQFQRETLLNYLAYINISKENNVLHIGDLTPLKRAKTKKKVNSQTA